MITTEPALNAGLCVPCFLMLQCIWKSHHPV